MDEIGIEQARPALGEIVDKARLAETYTVITRQGKEAAVVVSPRFFYAVIDYLAITMDTEGRSALELEWHPIVQAIREARRRAGLKPQDKRVVYHIDGDVRNNDPANLRIGDVRLEHCQRPTGWGTCNFVLDDKGTCHGEDHEDTGIREESR